MLVDQDLLSYDAQVSDYWPEFAQNGKGGENIKVEDVLRHECGLTSLDHTFDLQDFSIESIKNNVIGKAIESCKAKFPHHNYNPSDGSESRRSYHAKTRGLVLNEIVRRVDLQGRTIGQILRDDIKIDGLYLGLKESELPRIASLESWSKNWVIWNCMIPYFLGSKVDISIFELYQRKRSFAEGAKKIGPQKLVIKEDSKEPHMRHAINENPIIRKGEIPSSNCHGNAKGLATLAAIMANEGYWTERNTNLISSDTWKKMHANPKWALDAYLGNRALFLKKWLCKNTFTIISHNVQIKDTTN